MAWERFGELPREQAERIEAEARTWNTANRAESDRPEFYEPILRKLRPADRFTLAEFGRMAAEVERLKAVVRERDRDLRDWHDLVRFLLGVMLVAALGLLRFD